MPIDVRLLRSADDASQVIRWQSLRAVADEDPPNDKNAGNDGGEQTVRRVIQIDHDARQAQKILNNYKSSCRQEQKRPDPETLQSYQQDYDQRSAQLKQSLCQIANAVDETLLLSPKELTQQSADSCVFKNGRKETKISGIVQSPYRRLIEFGALEATGDIQQLSNSNNNGLDQSNCLLSWTGLGQDWAHAISSCLDSNISRISLFQRSQRLQLPMELPLEQDLFHEMLGCSKSQTAEDCFVCSDPITSTAESDTTTVRQAASWLGYLKLNFSDQTLGDKQLPQVLSYTVRASSNIHNGTNNSELTSSIQALDPREQLREESFSESQFVKSQAGRDHDMHLVLMLTSSTYSDSRGAQQELVDQMVSFYQSLLLPSDTSSTTAGDYVRQRITAPSHLLPAEASRIIIEGYLPKLDKDGNAMDAESGRWIILGYISNFSDYPARACRIKNNQQQFCHVLQGLFCSIPETMCWQACHGNSLHLGSIHLPQSLAEHFSRRYPNPLVLSQIKSLEKTKNGRIQLRTIQPPKSGGSAPPAAKNSNRQTELSSDRKSNNKGNRKVRGALIALVEPNMKLGKQQIRSEALSSPHDFLPFY